MKRLERCELLITFLKHRAAGCIHFFSDEKISCVDAKINHQNDRWKNSKDPDDVPVIGRTKFPFGLHVLEVISNEGNVTSFHFFGKTQTLTKEVYLDVMKML